MASISVIKLKVRRGTDSDRKQIVFDQGELAYTLDSKRLFVGDGLNKGGISTSSKVHYTNTIASGFHSTAQIGDLVFDTSTAGGLFVLTGYDVNGAADFSNIDAYRYVGPKFDSTIFTVSTALSAYTITNLKAANFNSGFIGQGLTQTPVSIKINIDNQTIQFNGASALFVDTASLVDGTTISVSAGLAYVDSTKLTVSAFPTSTIPLSSASTPIGTLCYVMSGANKLLAIAS